MKISSVQLCWALAILVILGFFIPWAHYVGNQTPKNSLEIASRLGHEREILGDYVLINWYDRSSIWKNIASGASGFQIVLTEARTGDEDDAARFVGILFGDESIAGKLFLLAPLMALVSAVALMYRKKCAQMIWFMIFLEILFYLFCRWKLEEVFVDRFLLLELSLGIWLTLYSLLLMALVQMIRMLMSPKRKW